MKGQSLGWGEEEFTGSWFEGAFLEGTGCGLAGTGRRVGGLGKPPRHFGHAFLGDVEMGENPFVLFIQPDAPIAVLAPA